MQNHDIVAICHSYHAIYHRDTPSLAASLRPGLPYAFMHVHLFEKHAFLFRWCDESLLCHMSLFLSQGFVLWVGKILVDNELEGSRCCSAL